MTFSSNSLIYIIILLQFLVEVKSQIEIFRPEQRYSHTATYINDKLYVLGGEKANMIPSKELFLLLDVSVPFNTNELKWYTLSSNIVPLHSFAASVKGGTNNNTLFLYGGDGTMNLVYTFDTQNNLWRIPAISGIQPTGRIGITPVIDYNGLLYLLYGTTNRTVESTHVNDMFVLDTINLSWKSASLINAPSPRVQYGAVFLPNQNIIYIGGYNSRNNPSIFPLNEVYLYDTKNDIWTTRTTYGSIPSARFSISSVLGLDGQRVIIYGGNDQLGKTVDPGNSVYVLDINNYNWYPPKVSGKIPSSRAFHKTVLIGKYMVVTFGEGYTQGAESDILLLDISNNDEYIWTTSFESPSVSTPIKTQTNIPSSSLSTSSNPSSNNNPGPIVGAVIGSLVCGILLTIGSFFLYKRYKIKKEQIKAIPTPGDARNDYSQRILQIPGGQEIMQNNLRQTSHYNDNRMARNF